MAASTRIRRLERRSLLLTLLAAGLLAVTILRPRLTTGLTESDLPLLFASLDTSAVRRVVIEQEALEKEALEEKALEEEDEPSSEDAGTPSPPEDFPPEFSRVVLAQKGEAQWVLSSRFDHPVPEGSASRLLQGIAGARLRQVVTRRPETFDRYRFSDGWVRVRLEDGSGNRVAAFEVGRSGTDDVFLKVQQEGEERIVKAINLRPSYLGLEAGRLKPTRWIEQRIFGETIDDSDVVRIDIDRGEKAPVVRIVRHGVPLEEVGLAGATLPKKDPKDTEKVWAMIAPTLGHAKTFETDDLVRSVSGMQADDVLSGSVPSPAEAETYGFDAPAVTVTLWVRRDKAGDKGTAPVDQQVLIVGRRLEGEGEGWAVRKGDGRFVYRVAAGHSVNSLLVEPADLLMAPARPSESGGG